MKSCQVDEKGTCTSFDVGDVDGALAKSEKVVKGRIDTPRQEHFYEETASGRMTSTRSTIPPQPFSLLSKW